MQFAVPGELAREEKPRAPRRQTIVCEVATETRDAARAVIEDAILNHPRSLQTEIGPSEVGNPCEFCLGAKLAGFQEKPEVAWLPFIGTAVHEKLEAIFVKHHASWIAEQRVRVGQILEEGIDGNSDLFHLPVGTVVDWKIVGKTTLDEVRLSGRPAEGYRAQAHLYGRGFTLLGHKVQFVAVFFLPRNSRSLDDAIWWAEEYDEDVAIKALKRADDLAKQIDIFGWDYWKHHLPKLDGCYGCDRWDFGGDEK